MDLVINDPKWVKPTSYSLLERTFLPLMKDERDLIFIRTSALLSLTVFPLAIALFLSPAEIVWMAALPYIGFVFLNFGGRFGLMLHATGHRPIFKREYKFIQNYIPFVMGPFLGHTPTSFAAHHMWMHHAENNMLGDASSTLPYKRDSFFHFLHYFVRFFFMGHFILTRYLLIRGRNKTALRFWFGELCWFALAGLALSINAPAALVVFIIPMLMMRWLMMAGNFAQHAFIDVTDPDNGYKNSNNLVNAGYNHKAYNDGYHIVHHLKPAMHWTDMAQYFEDNMDKFAEADAVCFDGLGDNQSIWFNLMFKRYDNLANHLVNFKGRTHEEKVAFLKSRVQTQVGEIPPILFWETDADVVRFDRKTGVSVNQALATE
ncbi:MAG: fatty acid desaturase [Rhodobacterales bacterium]|nr:fatty acid desaturase [Rhodobacterales bacterium]